MHLRTHDQLRISPVSYSRLGYGLSHPARDPGRSRSAGGNLVALGERALAFYLSQELEIVRRSPVDSAGRPYPLLCLEDSHAAANV